ncbi:MAG: U32 family peptidase [Chitinispirillaceae bacterium]|nr:U32 family peptidase [Chitinispirillaceae bacterium]
MAGPVKRYSAGRDCAPAPELLAPAGSIESFHAALEAGADAVYVGLTDFNARLRAKNFTAKALSYVVPYARSRRIKVYVAMNTLLKQADLDHAIHLLYQLEQIGVDAVIITDPGLITIAREHFSKLALHGSTQMVIHNSAGVAMAERLGLRRVTLSRECSLNEINSIKRTSRIELEVFIHGALCYSISGLCLASSFLGGSSGNRGRCTQVCRRRFSTGQTGGYCFSPRDFEALEFISVLAGIGIASFKIEGRMKNPEYVYQVTRAYRSVIDNPKRMDEARDLLADDLGRKKTSFFLSGTAPPGTIDAVTPGIGRLIGKIEEVTGNRISIQGTASVGAGDRIRIQPRDGFEGEAVTVDSVDVAGLFMLVCLKRPVACAAGDAVYLVGRHSIDKRFNCGTVVGGNPVRFAPRYPRARAIIKGQEENSTETCGRDTLWVKIDDPAWFDHLYATPCQRLVFAADPAGMSSLLGNTGQLRLWKSRLVPALPPFIPEADLSIWRSAIQRFGKQGIVRWMCTHIGQKALFDKRIELIADASVWSLNRATQTALFKDNFSGFVYSYEDDYLNIKARAASKGAIYLFSHPPLFVSRLHPAMRIGGNITDAHGNRFRVVKANNLFFLLPAKPCCITQQRIRLHELGIRHFILDLSFLEPDPALLASLIHCYANAKRFPGSVMFNYKSGLK